MKRIKNYCEDDFCSIIVDFNSKGSSHFLEKVFPTFTLDDYLDFIFYLFKTDKSHPLLRIISPKKIILDDTDDLQFGFTIKEFKAKHVSLHELSLMLAERNAISFALKNNKELQVAREIKRL